LASQVSSKKGLSQVFIYLDLGNGSYVTQGTKGYAEAETFLKKFAEDAILYDDVRVAEEAMKESEKNFSKLTRKGESLRKDIEKTEKELTSLRKDLEVNVKDVATSQTDLETKKKTFEDAKAKIPTKQ
jgi:chromosome segregation ATPase